MFVTLINKNDRMKINEFYTFAKKMLYPIKFNPILFEKIWGGNKLKTILNKSISSDKTGESWEISSVENEVSVVANGFLKENTLTELIEIYLSDLLGERVYQKYGEEFPLLIKFIDAHDDLSVQVHPPDEVARERHHAYGKTEMWYIVDAEPNAYIYLGFNENISKEDFAERIDNDTLIDVLNKIPAQKGDVFFVPAGQIHAIGKGILLAEIQQTSDITYRVFDWNRTDAQGKPRQLHIDEAIDVINYQKLEQPKVTYKAINNQAVQLISCPYFTTNLLTLNKTVEREYEWIDSFKILIFIDGRGNIVYESGTEPYARGDVFLIPAELHEISLQPAQVTELLEVYINV